MASTIENRELRTAWVFVENTGRSIFLTGKKDIVFPPVRIIPLFQRHNGQNVTKRPVFGAFGRLESHFFTIFLANINFSSYLCTRKGMRLCVSGRVTGQTKS